MYKKIIKDAMENANLEYLEYLNSEEFRNGLEISEKDIPHVAATFMAKSWKHSTVLIEKVLLELFESEDFKRELFKEMIEQGKKEAKRTQSNPFEV